MKSGFDLTYAQAALNTYASRPGSCSGPNPDLAHIDDLQCDLVDLIADLLHLADELNTVHGYLGNGGPGAAESAFNHYHEEAGITEVVVDLG